MIEGLHHKGDGDLWHITALAGEARWRKKSDHICFGSGPSPRWFMIMMMTTKNWRFLCVYQSSLKGWQHGRDDADDHDIVAGTDTDADHEDFPHLHLCCKKEEVPLYKQLILHISLPYPGVLRHTYEGAVMMTQQKTCIFHLIKYFSDFQKQLSAAKPSIVHNFTNFCSVPKRAPDRGLPHNWLNGWSFADHLLPRHARGKSQRGPGIVDNGDGDAMELNSCYI